MMIGMIAMEPYNTASAAKKLGVSAATVSRWAKRLSLGRRLGPSLLLSEIDVKKIGENCHHSAGNPEFGKREKI